VIDFTNNLRAVFTGADPNSADDLTELLCFWDLRLVKPDLKMLVILTFINKLKAKKLGRFSIIKNLSFAF